MFLTVLNRLMAEKAITKSKLAQNSGIPYTTIDGWYKKGYENVRLATLLKLSDYFNVSLDYLVGKPDNNMRIGLTEIEMLNIYKQLDSHGRRVVDLIIREELGRIRSDAVPKVSKSQYEPER
ncbi:MAG: XRE family transcriptional regulator [Clostridiales bacterium]|nr:XRE family transcriptional regulator [Clostridiales bacterium]